MIKKGWLILGLVLLLAGCATTSTLPEKAITLEEIKQNITFGQTTKQDILKIFGRPISIAVSSFLGHESEAWAYIITEMTKHDAKMSWAYAFAGKQRIYTHQTSLIIIFNQNGIVTNYTATSSRPIE